VVNSKQQKEVSAMKKVLVGFVLALVAAFAVIAGFTVEVVAQGDKIVAYVAYTDYEEEWENTKRAIIESGVIPDFLERLVEVKEEANDPDKLRAYLVDASVFLIPEQPYDGWLAGPRRERGRMWAPILKEFLARGGRIVGLWDSVFYLNGAGLTIAGGEAVGDAVGGTLEVVVPDHPLVTSPLMVSRTFRAEDYTAFYPRVDGTVLVQQKDRPERPVVFVKGIEAGQIVVLGFDFYEFNEDMKKLLANAVVGVVVDCKGSIKLEANELLIGQKIGGKALTETKEKQYCIPVAAGAKLFAVKLESKGNLDLHIRQGKPVERSGQAIIADYSLPSPDGNEFLLIFAPQLKAGPYFIAVENKEDSEQEFTIIATPIFDIQELKGSAEGSVAPNAGLIPFLRQYLATQGGMLGLTQYKFDVPGGAKSVTIRLEGPADRTLNLHLRHDKPVEIVKDQVAADLSVIGPGGQKGVVLAGTLLKAGRWYIAVESLQPNEKVDYRVVVEIETGTQKIMMVLEREPKK
jgi:hypothetical protein